MKSFGSRRFVSTHDRRTDEQNQLGAALDGRLSFEHGAEQRDVPEERHLSLGDGLVLTDQTAEHDRALILNRD